MNQPQVYICPLPPEPPSQVPVHPDSVSESRSVVSDSLQPHGLYSPWNSPGQNTGVGSLSLLQGIFPTQGLNPGLLNCRQIRYQLSHKRSPISHMSSSKRLLFKGSLLECAQWWYRLPPGQTNKIGFRICWARSPEVPGTQNLVPMSLAP